MSIWDNCVWKTAEELCGVEAGQPLAINIESEDIKQNQLGNCWLIAGISAVAEYAADKGDENLDISSVFLTKEYYPNQPVDIQLYDFDKETGQMEPKVFSVRDSFPATPDGEPICAVPKDNKDDVWVMFLVAAFAMLWSGKDTLDFDAYNKIHGGQGVNAMRHLTGITCIDRIWKTDRDGQSWELEFLETGDKRDINKEHLWQMLVDAEAAGEMMTAGTMDINGDGTGGDVNDVNGVYETHEYTLQQVYVDDDGVMMVRLRNPWGHHGSTEDSLRNIAVVDEDGCFELDFDKFTQYWQDIGIVNRSRGGSCLDHTPYDGADKQKQDCRRGACAEEGGEECGEEVCEAEEECGEEECGEEVCEAEEECGEEEYGEEECGEEECEAEEEY